MLNWMEVDIEHRTELTLSIPVPGMISIFGISIGTNDTESRIS